MPDAGPSRRFLGSAAALLSRVRQNSNPGVFPFGSWAKMASFSCFFVAFAARFGKASWRARAKGPSLTKFVSAACNPLCCTSRRLVPARRGGPRYIPHAEGASAATACLYNPTDTPHHMLTRACSLVPSPPPPPPIFPSRRHTCTARAFITEALHATSAPFQLSVDTRTCVPARRGGRRVPWETPTAFKKTLEGHGQERRAHVCMQKRPPDRRSSDRRRRGGRRI